MKTTRIFLLITAGLLAVLYSCELLDNPTDLSVAERLEGRWLCEEDNPYKSAEDAYYVYIDISRIDSNTILIDKFFQLSSGAAYATISGMTLTLPNQTLEGGFDVYGSGTIASGYKQITWQYYVDDGSGDWSEISSIYTKEDY